ncbi:tyrosine-type recombinase/integrase [Avibacterium paragallinarum]|uniref:Integrase n=1 Tax=Avibacterium paragallinarum TaxID=728 RepID=A0AAE5TKI7_AVIPA|nr:site-specific integrase [Avibacterium paragallinarum]MEE3608150.1 site-specific integrase [Avibacterium paragallinarum]MEE3622176.1 site-specific integrase [Avibacterium paragallinarum]MEE3669279.1 site-specific integrase [Avibacterium paragallinarum]MEE3681405.1 site-specific integrase [Avibacterium paragallinarum]MEE4386715.1 site-specific integrase [Avibacterium paragallinarum]
MATVTKSATGWRVQIRKKGIYKSGTFRTKAEAQMWANKIESEINAGTYSNIPDITFADLIDKYIKEITVHKKSKREETLRLTRLAEMDIGKIKLAALTEQDFIAWRDERLSKVKPASVIREWNTLSHLLNTAIKEWKYLKINHLSHISKPKDPPPRTRRYSDEEIARLTFVSGYDENHMPLTVQSRVGAAMLFAIETAMRAGEICKATWQDFNPTKRLLFIPQSKNGYSRTVPLSSKAIAIIERLATIRTADDRIFQLNAASLDAIFRQLKERAGLADADLHFHDTRREALSRLSKKVEVLTLAKISGHRDLKILLNTYYAPDMAEIADLLG